MISEAVADDRSPPPTAPRLRRLADWLARRRVALLAVVALVCAAAIGPASRLDLDESVAAFFSPDDPLLRNYQQSRLAFGGDEFVLVAYEEDRPTFGDQLEELAVFSNALSSVPGVQKSSTQDLERLLRVSSSPVITALPRIIRLAAHRAIRERLTEFARRLMIGDHDDVSAILLRLDPESAADAPREETFREIRRLAAAHDPPAYVAGEPLQIFDMFRYVERDSRVLGVASTALMVLVILFLFRSLRWVVMPLLIVQATLLWTKALLDIVGLKLSMVSSMLTSLLTIIGIATMMHITIVFRGLRAHADRRGAFVQTFALMASPIFWVTVTTVVGFASLLCSEITPVRSFSWMMTIGTSLLLLTFPLILPGGVLIGRFHAEPGLSGVERHVERALDRLTIWVHRHAGVTLSVAAVITVLAAIGCLRQRVETDFSKNFKPGSPIVQSIRFFESRLGGVGSWEVNFAAPDELNSEFLERVRELAARLKALRLGDGTQLTKVVALTDGLDLIPSVLAEDWVIKRDWLHDLQPEFEASLYNSGKKRMRIVLRALEQQPAENKLELIGRVRATAQKYFPDAQATGLFVLLANLITSILGDQLTSAWLSATGIFLCVWCAFRNWRLGVIALAPNILPILLVVGSIGWTGTPVNIGAAMVASVSLGLTVDASILYLADYQRARVAGKNHLDAVQETHAGAGLALVLATLALTSGFAVLMLSEFIPLVFFGGLVSVAMAGGLLGNLVLLPLLLRWVKYPMPTPERTL